jgi:hypothetical protein
MCCLVSLNKKRAHGISEKRNQSAPKRLFLLFSVLGSFQVLFFAPFLGRARPISLI